MIPHCLMAMTNLMEGKDGTKGTLHIWPEKGLENEEPKPYGGEYGVPCNQDPISFSEFIDNNFAVQWSERCLNIDPNKFSKNDVKAKWGWGDGRWRREDLIRYSGTSGNAEAYCIAQYYYCGRVMFSFSKALFDALSDTEVEIIDISPELIRLPFPVIFISTPPNKWGFNGMYLIERGSSLFVGMVKYSGTNTFDYVVAPFVLDLSKGDNLLECIDDDGRPEIAFVSVPLVANAILYINSGRADLSEPIRGRATRKLENAGGKGKGEKWLCKMNRMAATEPIVIRVGDNYKPSSGEGTSGWHYSKRFMRRGHWRRQRWGVKLSKVKMKWIEPHWVGPTLGDRIHGRQYDVVMGDRHESP